jgi:hypothetical protein
MSWWLPTRIRRIIALLLLVLDLGLEPGSAVSFVGISDSDDEAVADLCRTDDFYWGIASSCATIEATISAQKAASASDSEPVATSCARTSVSANFHILAAIETPFEITLVEARQAFAEPWLHRNTYIAQKRGVVLII